MEGRLVFDEITPLGIQILGVGRVGLGEFLGLPARLDVAGSEPGLQLPAFVPPFPLATTFRVWHFQPW